MSFRFLPTIEVNPPRLALGCWKSARDLSDSFLRELVDTGFDRWDLGESYGFFGAGSARLDFRTIPIRRDEVIIDFKIGASTMREGEIDFRANAWDAAIEGFLSVTGAEVLDTLMLWKFPAFHQLEAVIRWMEAKVREGKVKELAFANISCGQFELLVHSISQVAFKKKVQIRCTPFIIESCIKVAQMQALGAVTQVYGVFHSGLIFDGCASTHSDYITEYRKLGPAISASTAGKTKVEVMADAVSRVARLGVNSLILSPRDRASLRELREALCLR